jgi:hypothetical protein
MIDKQVLKNKLPKVGDVRMETPTAPQGCTYAPQECVVVYVNEAHLWYRVRFVETGFHECYKVPQTGRLEWEE